MSGRTRTANERIEWRLEAVRGRLATRSLQAIRMPLVDTDDGWGEQRASTWNRPTRTGYELTLRFGPDDLGFGQEQPVGHTMPACEDGLVVDVAGTIGETELRVLGIASAAFPPDDWEDDDAPELAGCSGRIAVNSEEFWLGLFWPEAD
jgi:hypothetical protein